MSSRWHQKKAKLQQEAWDREERNRPDELFVKDQASAQAMGDGEEELFEKKLSKEEKKARAKAAREAKKKAKGKAGKKGKNSNGADDNDDDAGDGKGKTKLAIPLVGKEETTEDDGIDHTQTDKLIQDGTICTYAASRKGVDARARDINVQNVTLQHKGAVMLNETEIVLNHGNRYGLVGRNGCGKSTLLKTLGARAVPIPKSIDIFFLKEEVEASDTLTALEAVMEVDEERLRLEQNAEELNQMLTALAEEGDDVEHDDGKTSEELQEEVMETLNSVYERLDALDAATAEVRARTILKGLGFTHEMQAKKTKDFSGGWRMRVSLARALFIQPVCLLLDEPTNHLGA